MEEFRHNTDLKKGTGKDDEREDRKAKGKEGFSPPPKQRLLANQQLLLMKT